MESTKASYDFVKTSYNRVMVTSGGLDRFARVWPCSGMRFDLDIAVEFEFDSRSELVGVSWFDCSGQGALEIAEPEGIDQSALLALLQDAQAYLSAN